MYYACNFIDTLYFSVRIKCFLFVCLFNEMCCYLQTKLNFRLKVIITEQRCNCIYLWAKQHRVETPHRFLIKIPP